MKGGAPSGDQSKANWRDGGALSLLGMAKALPGSPVSTESLLSHVCDRFGIDIRHRGLAAARRMKVASRHLSRELVKSLEAPRAGHRNAELAATALQQALDAAGLRANELDYVISHTATPSQLIPPNAATISELIEYDGPYLELRQACTGFANALIVARGLIEVRQSALIAIVGSETGSVFFDPLRAATDAGQLVNLIQMGDGAAACVVCAPRDNTPRISHLYFGQAGRDRAPGFTTSAGGSDAPWTSDGLIEFKHDFDEVRESGPELFRFGMQAALDSAISLDDVDYFIPHQANGRMDEILAPLLQCPRERVFVNADRLGNTGSAAIWLALFELSQRMRTNQRALILGAEATKYMCGGFLYTHS